MADTGVGLTQTDTQIGIQMQENGTDWIQRCTYRTFWL